MTMAKDDKTLHEQWIVKWHNENKEEIEYSLEDDIEDGRTKAIMFAQDLLINKGVTGIVRIISVATKQKLDMCLDRGGVEEMFKNLNNPDSYD